MIKILKQVIENNILDWYALADAYEEERYENAKDIVRELIIPYIKFRLEKEYEPWFNGLISYYWTCEGNKENKSLIPKEIYKYLKYNRYDYPTPYPSREEAFRALWLAYIEAKDELC